MARTRSAGFDDQRELILAHSAALFARQGFTATSMNEVAAACGVSKATLYHYVRDKHGLLLGVAEAHVARLEALVEEVWAQPLAPRERLAALISRFVRAYADAQNQHRVLTEDVKFLDDEARQRVLDTQRRVVARFAQAVQALRPDLAEAALAKALTMLLFGMINWMFTWVRPDGRFDHAALAPLVSDLFIGGLLQLHAQAGSAAKAPARAAQRDRPAAAAPVAAPGKPRRRKAADGDPRRKAADGDPRRKAADGDPRRKAADGDPRRKAAAT